MQEAVEQTLTDTIQTIVMNIQSLVEQHGEDGVELAGFVLQMEIAYYLFLPFILLPLGFVTAILALKKANILQSCPSKDDIKHFPVMCLYGLTGFMSLAGGFITLFDYTLRPALWVAMFDPHVAIAVKALGML